MFKVVSALGSRHSGPNFWRERGGAGYDGGMEGIQAAVTLVRKEDLWSLWVSLGREQVFVLNRAAVGPGVVVWMLEQG